MVDYTLKLRVLSWQGPSLRGNKETEFSGGLGGVGGHKAGTCLGKKVLDNTGALVVSELVSHFHEIRN